MNVVRPMGLLLALTLNGGAAQAEVPEYFVPLAFLAGHCWQGSFPDGKRTDEHCFEWQYGGKFLRDRHVVRGGPKEYRGETLYAYAPERGQVVYWYWNSDGGVSTGAVNHEDPVLVFPDEIYEGKSGRQIYRSRWEPLDASTYRVLAERKDGERWVEAWHMDMKRRKASGKSE